MINRHPRRETDSRIDRREFLRLMGASMALAGISACSIRYPVEQIVPYVSRPQSCGDGDSVYYATSLNVGGCGFGVLAESFEGRPIKIEGNPIHPASLGATDVFAQAAVLSLYDPDRSRVVTRHGEPASWHVLVSEFRQSASKLDRGNGLRILSPPSTSPTLSRMIAELLALNPGAAWHQFQPINRDNERTGALLALGRDVRPVYDFTAADVVVSLGNDLLRDPRGGVRYARDLVQRRKVRLANKMMSRLYVFETTPSVTGSIADRRIAADSAEIENIARAIHASINGNAFPSPLSQSIADIVSSLTNDLVNNRGRSMIIAGPQQVPAVHAIVHAINSDLQNIGKTVNFIPPFGDTSLSCLQSITALANDMRTGLVKALIILDGNPVYDAPADLDLSGALEQVPLTIHLGQYANETSQACIWHIPQAHELESWGDTQSFDGTVSVIQPLIAPLYQGKTAHEVVAALSGNEASSHGLVRQTWEEHQNWDDLLRDGIIAGTASQYVDVAVRSPLPVSVADQPAGIEVVFAPDPTVWDGSHANNAWLQELPKPISKLTWGNAALMSRNTANTFGISNEIAEVGGSHGHFFADEIEISLNGQRIDAPAMVIDGHADNSITLHLGGGRTAAGSVGNGVGYNSYALRTSVSMDVAAGAQVRPTGRKVSVACTQDHHSMEGRDLVRRATLDEYTRDPGLAKRPADDPSDRRSLFPDWSYEGHAWAMVVDNNVCSGCNACVIACQAENNIPVVGKEEVERAREMHWLRIDQYFESKDDETSVLNQPVPCQHCENAPCEVVCPVEATTHSAEGINEMTYNRCVGTRYCSNNCPYKVRRFNFFGYSDLDTPLVQLRRNPEVTTRSRGVMEKCTYCVQRIERVKIRAEREERDVRDGEIVTACQQACPTEAIIFGDMNDPNSRVAALKREPSNYSLLGELNTRPRTTYLPIIRNI